MLCCYRVIQYFWSTQNANLKGFEQLQSEAVGLMTINELGVNFDQSQSQSIFILDKY